MIKTTATLIVSCCLLLNTPVLISTVQAAEKPETPATTPVTVEKTDTTAVEVNSTQVSVISKKQYPDTFKIQLGSYFIRDTNTEVSVNSTIGGIGTTINMERDLGTDDKLSIPRVDAYYRFNDNHRIDFSWFQVSRKGTRALSIDITIDGEVFSSNSVVESEIKTNFYKLAYGYSFYRSPKVELLFTAGLNVLKYSVEFKNKSNGKLEAAAVTAPLPVFGLRMDYALAPRWLVHYRFETFYIEFSDEFRGSLVDTELGIEYQLFNNVGLGLGLNRFAVDAQVKSSSYTGGLIDLYRGVNFYVSANF